MRIQQALEVSKNVAKNNVMLSILETAINNCMIGKSWVEPFEESGFLKGVLMDYQVSFKNLDL